MPYNSFKYIHLGEIRHKGNMQIAIKAREVSNVVPLQKNAAYPITTL